MEYIQKEKSRFERDRMSIHVCTLLGNREQSKEVKAALGRNGKKRKMRISSKEKNKQCNTKIIKII